MSRERGLSKNYKDNNEKAHLCIAHTPWWPMSIFYLCLTSTNPGRISVFAIIIQYNNFNEHTGNHVSQVVIFSERLGKRRKMLTWNKRLARLLFHSGQYGAYFPKTGSHHIRGTGRYLLQLKPSEPSTIPQGKYVDSLSLQTRGRCCDTILWLSIRYDDEEWLPSAYSSSREKVSTERRKSLRQSVFLKYWYQALNDLPRFRWSTNLQTLINSNLAPYI